jgi:hypothetical protein
MNNGAWGSVVVKALVGRSRDRFPVLSLGIFPWLRRNHVPWRRLSLWKWVPEISPAVKATGAYGWRPTTLVVPNVKEIRGLNRRGTPWATSACCGRPLHFTWTIIQVTKYMWTHGNTYFSWHFWNADSWFYFVYVGSNACFIGIYWKPSGYKTWFSKEYRFHCCGLTILTHPLLYARASYPCARH